MSADKPDTIDELFRRGYSTWDDQDLDRMVDYLRAHRVKLGNLDEKPVRASKAPKIDVGELKGKSPEEVLSALGLDLKL